MPSEKMLENRPNDALEKLAKLLNIVTLLRVCITHFEHTVVKLRLLLLGVRAPASVN